MIRILDCSCCLVGLFGTRTRDTSSQWTSRTHSFFDIFTVPLGVNPARNANQLYMLAVALCCRLCWFNERLGDIASSLFLNFSSFLFLLVYLQRENGINPKAKKWRRWDWRQMVEVKLSRWEEEKKWESREGQKDRSSLRHSVTNNNNNNNSQTAKQSMQNHQN